MKKRKNLVITGLTDEYRQAFLDLADTLELSRDQLMVLLMTGSGVAKGGLDAVIPDRDAQIEWRDLMLHRAFELTKL